MKKGYIILLAIVLLIIIMASAIIGRYNKMHVLKVDADKAWGQVENVYQRRFDLIPNLVETVKGAANFEKSTLTDVIEARSKVGELKMTSETLTDPQALQAFQQAQDGLSSALSRLMVVVEKYPELKANQNFLELQTQLEGTENRIATERMRFNDAVGNLNQYIVKFPNNLLASMFGIKELPFFRAAAGAEQAPKVDFKD